MPAPSASPMPAAASLRVGLAVSLVVLVAGCAPAADEPVVVPTPATPAAAQTGDPAPPTTPTEAPETPALAATPTAVTTPPLLAEPTLTEHPVPDGARPHDVAPGADGVVWYTAQRQGALGVLDPASGEVEHIALGDGSAPHGVIVGPDGAAWVTDGGLNAIVRVDPDSHEVRTFPLPRPAHANLNTAAFDGDGVLWFTGQEGVYGRVDPTSEAVEVFDAPRGRGPYGIAATPDGTVWFSSLAGSYIARIDGPDGALTVVDVPTPGGGARRVWSDSDGGLWVTEWFAGNLARYDPAADAWQEWSLPGDDPAPYAVYVDDADQVWVTDFGGDALLRFDPAGEEFAVFPYPTGGAEVRQLLGRPGEVWGAGSATDSLIVAQTR